MIRRAVLTLISALSLGCHHLNQLVHLMSSRPDASAPPVYAERCSSCHGDSGHGDGAAGRTLAPPPRNFADRSWQAATSDDRIRFVIRNGGRAAGLSPLMAPHGDLSHEQLEAVVAYIRRVGER